MSSTHNRWYDEEHHDTVMSEILKQDAKQITLNAIDIKRIEG